jgi:predicted RNase H-like nuclease (RuvC/YqgF family)
VEEVKVKSDKKSFIQKDLDKLIQALHEENRALLEKVKQLESVSQVSPTLEIHNYSQNIDERNHEFNKVQSNASSQVSQTLEIQQFSQNIKENSQEYQELYSNFNELL